LSTTSPTCSDRARYGTACHCTILHSSVSGEGCLYSYAVPVYSWSASRVLARTCTVLGNFLLLRGTKPCHSSLKYFGNTSRRAVLMHNGHWVHLE
jgi:hypothetical protein